MIPIRRIATTSLVALSLLLNACATSTPYQPNIPGQSPAGGYSDERLAENRYRVTFTGNSFTSRDRVEGYMLYRAAELTLERGYDWFRIVDRVTERDRRTYVEPGLYNPWYGYGYRHWRPSWNYYRPGFGWRTWYPYGGDPFWTDSYDVRTVEQFEAHAEIVVQRGTPAGRDQGGFDARQVLAELGPTIQRRGTSP